MAYIREHKSENFNKDELWLFNDTVKNLEKENSIEIVNYDTLLEKNAGIGFEKQYSLSVVIGDRNWEIDADKGIIVFGGEIEMSMQILGSYSYESETWMWIWANEQAAYPPEVTTYANKMKEMGEKYNIEFLTKSQYRIEPTDVHALGMIASGEFGASAYYAGDYGDGIALLILNSKQVDEIEYNEQARILTAFPQIIEVFSINHKRGLRNYLQQKGYAIAEENENMVAHKNENKIVSAFDQQQRLININGKITK